VTLHMVQLVLEPRWLAAWTRSAGLPGDDEGYLVHAALRAAFGVLAPQPFAVMGGDAARPLKVLGYGAADEAALRAALDAPREPLLAKGIDCADIHSKAMPNRFRAGTSFGFDTRTCPIVRMRRDDGKPRELDAFVHATLGVDRDQVVSRETVYADWLRTKLIDGGAETTAVRVHRLDQAPLVRRCGGSARRLWRTEDGRRVMARRPDVTFRGTLRVVDPDRFVTLLARGVGRHRAFGFGMLLLRPA
jgi:CRISPR system Cascade subunit CasE